jgi:MFS family permease
LSKFPGAYRPIFWISFFPGALAFLLLILFVKEKSVDGATINPVPRRKFDWRELDSHCKLFYIVTTIFGLANASYAFFLLKASSLGVTGSANTLLYLVYSLVPAFLFFPIGRWTDHHGRKLALLLGYFLFALTAVSFTAANQFMVWILFALYGASMALTDGVTRAFISDMVHPDVRGTALGIYYALNGVAAFIASAAFGYLWDKLGQNLPFVVSSVLAAIAGLVFIIFIIHHSYCRRRGKTPFCEKC